MKFWFSIYLALPPMFVLSQNIKDKEAIIHSVEYIARFDFNQKVVMKFKEKNDTLIIKKDYAYISALPIQPNGKNVDLSKGIYKYIESGKKEGFILEPNFTAVLQKINGIWHVLVYSVACTDECYQCWWKEYGVPTEVFPPYIRLKKDCIYLQN
jgi:hypothetical protein